MSADQWIQIRVTKEEKEHIRKEAEKAGVSISKYIKSLALKTG